MTLEGNLLEVGEAETTSRKRKAVDKLEMDVSNSSNSLWLVKVPEFLGEYLAQAQHNDVVGKLKITAQSQGPGKPKKSVMSVKLDGDGRRKVTATQDLILEEEVPIPVDYSMEDTNILGNNDVRMLAFSNDLPNNEAYTLHGKVSKSFMLRPNGAQYARLLRDRNVKSHDRSQTRASHDDNAILNINGERSRALIDFQAPVAAEMRKKAKEADAANKAAARRLTAGQTEDIMTDLRDKIMEGFATAERLKQADIQAYCHNVPGYTTHRVKTLLEDYCTYNTKGTYKHFWELKAEYKDALAPKEEEEEG